MRLHIARQHFNAQEAMYRLFFQIHKNTSQDSVLHFYTVSP